MGVRNVKQLFPESTAFVHYGLPLLCAVRYGNYRDACTFKVFQCLDGAVDGLLRKCAGAGSKVVYLFHTASSY